MIVRGIHEREGPWYVIEYNLANALTNEALPLGRLDWADWQASDLLFAKEGQIFRLTLGKGSDAPSLAAARRLIDLRAAKFQQVECPDDFKHW